MRSCSPTFDETDLQVTSECCCDLLQEIQPGDDAATLQSGNRGLLGSTALGQFLLTELFLLAEFAHLTCELNLAEFFLEEG